MTLNYRGKPVPFGATASLLQEGGAMDNSGIVGTDGQVYLSGVPEKGQLLVKWGNTASQQCQVDFALPKVNPPSSVATSDFICR
ncbi:FimD/PapC C-terminal domain-containing protein [Pseudomonas sp. TH31]|uniref:FimD/PapC C-terminal domain-containing protein n=1 Tax=Pseudomonas sp. TH31 TaxID=2796396 RepID=UPI001F5B6356|nr:FimD/PapC C-terminal domain-containing protein [Pseudomonas sp. TH31]